MSNRNKGRNSNNTGRNRRKRDNIRKQNMVMRPGPLPVAFAPKHRCILKYISHITGASNSGVQFLTLDYRANGLADPSTSGSDVSTPDNFATLATIYNNYIVNSCQLDLHVVNRESFDVNVVAGFFPGTKTIGTAAEAIDVGEGPFGKSRILSVKGGMDRAVIRKRVVLSELWNKRYYYGDSAFEGVGSTNPSVLAHIVICAIASSGNTMENGIGVQVRLSFDATFTGRMGTDQVTFDRPLPNTTQVTVSTLDRPTPIVINTTKVFIG